MSESSATPTSIPGPGWRRALATVFATAALAAVSAATASTANAVPINDDVADSLHMQLGDTDERSNADATIAAAERLTANDPAGEGCAANGVPDDDGIQMNGTLWWDFTGSGGPVTVSTLSSSFDTVLAVYETDGGQLVGCNDDLQAPDFTRPSLQFRLSSELVVDTVAGRAYSVQVGGCTPADQCGATTSGNVALRVSPTPPNDDRANATPVAAGGPVASANWGATLEPGELAACQGVPFAKTVWFRYTAPAPGTAAFSSAGFDTVLTVYRAGSTTPLGCNDDAVDKQFGASRVPMSQPPGAPVEVVPGDYLIQVGGFHNTGFTTVAARNGELGVQVEFAEDLDRDRDGVNRDRDCDDGNAGVRPGVPEVPNDAVDDDCDGLAAIDRDGDGAFAPPAGRDCRDGDPDVKPGAKENPGNRVDDNCDGLAADFDPLGAEIKFHWRRTAVDGDTLLRFVRVSGLERGVHVRLRCVGGGCPRRSIHVVIRRKRPPLRLLEGATLQPGARVTVRVTKPSTAREPGEIGQRRTLIARKRKPPIETVPVKLRPRVVGPS